MPLMCHGCCDEIIMRVDMAVALILHVQIHVSCRGRQVWFQELSGTRPYPTLLPCQQPTNSQLLIMVQCIAYVAAKRCGLVLEQRAILDDTFDKVHAWLLHPLLRDLARVLLKLVGRTRNC